MEKELNDIASLAATVCKTPVAVITIINSENRIKEGLCGISTEEIPAGIKYLDNKTRYAEKINYINDLQKSAEFHKYDFNTGSKKTICFYASIPIITDESNVIGTLSIIDYKPKDFSEALEKKLQLLSNQIVSKYNLENFRSEQKVIENAYQELIENAGDIIYETDAEGRFTYVNFYLINTTGYTQAELLDMTYTELVYKDDVKPLQNFYERIALEHKAQAYNEFRIVKKESKKVIKIWQNIKMYYANNKLVSIRAIARDVTAMREIDKKNALKEQLFNEMIEDQENSIFCSHAQDGTFKRVPSSMEKILGHDPDTLIGRSPYELLHPNDIDRVIKEPHMKTIMYNEASYMLYRIRKKESHYVWAESIFKPVLDKNGKIEDLVSVTRPISAKVQKEEIFKFGEERIREIKQKINETNANYQSLIEDSSDLIWCVDKDLRYLTFNKIYAAIYSKVVGEMPVIGEKIDIDNLPFSNERKKQMYENHQKVFNGELVKEEDLLYIDGKLHYYETTINPILGLGGEVLGISFFMHDATENYIRDTKLEKFQRGLKLINTLSTNIHLSYDELINKALKNASNFLEMPTAIISHILNDKFIVLNSYDDSNLTDFLCEKQLKLEEVFCEVTFKKNKITTINKASHSKYEKHGAFKNHKIESYIGGPLTVNNRKFGTICFLSSKPKEIQFDNYDVEFLQQLAHWISAQIDRKIREENLLQAKERAERASKAKVRFLSMMSHEIRTPLNAIIGGTHILLQENPMEEQKENLQMLKSSGQNLLHLINDVLDYNKIEAGKIILENTNFNLYEIIISLKESFNYQLEEKGLYFRFNYDQNTPKLLLGDPVRILQILNNLLSNAIKFTDNGTIEISVKTIEAKDNIAKMYFEVRDTGVGIKQGELKEIFDKFTKTSIISDNYSGAGLGLSIVSKLLKLLDSNIMVESKPGIGTKFYFELDMEIASKQETKVTLEQKIKFKDLTDHHIKVLLVEDNLMNQVVAKKFLQKWGIITEVADNGKIALEKITNMDYHLILMDLQMPEIDGYEATRKIRALKDPYYKEVPIIALTASAMMDVLQKTKDYGMNDYILKPIVPDILYNKVIEYSRISVNS